MKIGVFCSANEHIDPDYFQMTEALGQWIGHEGHQLVFGGCNMGLMECVARAVHEAGGTTIGMVPRVVEQGGRASSYLDVNVACDNLSDRKDLMLAQSDVLVALPGGIGTLDEIFTVAASHTIGYHHKLVILFDMKGFWKPLVALLDDLQARGFIRGHWTDYIRVARSLDEVQAEIASLA